MRLQTCHRDTFIHVSTLFRVRVMKRLVGVSIRNMSEERRSSGGAQIHPGGEGSEAGGGGEDTRGGGQTGGGEDTGGGVEETSGGNSLTEEEMTIHRLHRQACEAGEQMYVDPGSGYRVFTENAHRDRGRCCGSACRHVSTRFVRTVR
ncbi:uncharacterized protein C1orf53 homolog isoform X2 [Boleophthalmus pectinirostris]|uniref:uncharacterized protein C1orf53 homolog isoform X2 n=1 Tax=Boleophthalmus pectinirostris TaxID=150288 RepID=UPI00242E9EC6|nr:uncharacterized protein C1orf53 homolog isoform X2 [Boleophthalmus pectinirostris]